MKHFHRIFEGRIYYRLEDGTGTSYPLDDGCMDPTTFWNHQCLTLARQDFIPLRGSIDSAIGKIECVMQDWTIAQHIVFLQQMIQYAETREIKTKAVLVAAIANDHITVMDGVVIWRYLP